MAIRRVTIVLRPENEAKLRKVQAELIYKTNKGKSFSEIINCIIAEGLKHPRSCDE
ncbi:hypothetical protein [Candidatus Nitrosotenuis cloacae]|uniref:hypothetical protein n=1 Tax=Candidatus Nitrosotenuis cloacae TaxID=1603555 RepID=UPI00130E53D2|nr:hypothetical protein [Candidatus Nitrosotenuis cloacae]